MSRGRVFCGVASVLVGILVANAVRWFGGPDWAVFGFGLLAAIQSLAFLIERPK